jgi:hypothetical protein
MTSLADFNYVIQRLKRDADSPTAEALKLILLHGKLPVEAVRTTGVPMVRLMPPYDEARRILSAMYATEADGFTPQELPVANRALALARAKEMQYVPSAAELTALQMLRARPGSTALKAMNGEVDELPGATFKALTTLHAKGAVAAENEGLMRVRWTLTERGSALIEEGMKKR